MPRRFLPILAVAFALAGCGYEEYEPTSAPVAGPSGADGSYNCDDFGSHAEAQAYYEQQNGDPDGLDRDGDGLACESLP